MSILPRTTLATAADYDIVLDVKPVINAADGKAEIALTATVTAKTPGLRLEDLDIVFSVVGGSARFTDDARTITLPTDPTGVASAPMNCTVPGIGYAYAVLKLSDTDKAPSNEVSYEFVDERSALTVDVSQTDAFADRLGRVSINATLMAGSSPVPDEELRFKLTSTTAEFAGAPGLTSTTVKTDASGRASVTLAAASAQNGYIQVSVVDDTKIRQTSVFTFIPRPLLTLQLINNGALADGKSAITARATVIAALTKQPMPDVRLTLDVSGPVTPLGVTRFGGQTTLLTDQEGNTEASFTCTTPSAQQPEAGEHIVTAATVTDTAAPRYQQWKPYSFQ